MPCKITDKNSFRVCAYQTDRFKTLRMSFYAAVPLEGNISASAVLMSILSRSCEKYPGFIEFKDRLAELYGAIVFPTVRKIGESQLLGITIKAIDDKFALSDDSIKEQCADLLCDLIFRPHFENGTFSCDDIEREKRLLIEKIEGEKSNKIVYAKRRMEEFMFENELYSQNENGEVEEIEKLTSGYIYEAWKNMLMNARVQINCVGSGDFDCVTDKFEKEFSKIGRTSNEYKVSTEYINDVKEIRNVTEYDEIQQSKLVIGYRTDMKSPDDDYFAMRVMTDIFGGSPNSKLFMNVREKLSLCYYCGARLVRQKGIITVQAGIEKDNKDLAVNEIAKQLESLCDGDFAETDIENSKKSLIDSINSVNDDPRDIDDWYSSEIFEDKPLTASEFADKVEKVTKEDIIRAAKTVKLDTIYMLTGTEAEINGN